MQPQPKPVVKNLDIYPDPEPLPDSLPSVRKFELDMLPSALSKRAEEAARSIQAPIDFLAVAFVVALSSIVSRFVAIRPKAHDNWTVVPNLWGGGVGRPSTKKSPSFTEAISSLDRLEGKSAQNHESALDAYEQDRIVHEQRIIANKQTIKGLLKNSKDAEADAKKLEDAKSLAEEITKAAPEKPACIRYMSNDPTVAKLGEILADNPSLLVYRDELSGFMAGLERHGEESARAFYLEAWSGNRPFSFDRIGRGTVRVPRTCLSVFGGIQPGPLAKFMRETQRNSRGNDGLLQRFQVMVWPDLPKRFEFIDEPPDKDAWRETTELFENMAKLGDEYKTDEDGDMPYLRFAPDAQVVFSRWLTDHETRLRAEDIPECFEAHLGKYQKLVPAIALILYLAEGGREAVDLDSITKAIAWAKYLESHAKRIYAPLMGADFVSAKTLGNKLKSGALKSEFRVRDVYRNHWANLSTPDEARTAVDILEDYHWIFAHENFTDQESGGRPTVTYKANPKILEDNK